VSLDQALAAAVRAAIAPLEAKIEALTREVASLRATLPPALLRPSEVAERYGIPRSTQRRYVRQGRLRKVTIGRTVLIDVSRLQPLSAEEIAQMAAQTRNGR
jgi:excisionase family DNA binding protein